ncbi:MAG: hypothetical protein AB2A00_26685 [Myxococcota bacterium]
MQRAVLSWAMMLCCACGQWTLDPESCAEIPRERMSRLPSKLSETGLFSDIAGDTTADGVRPFTPQFQLWSDGASKRRWILLPAGTQIDTRNADFWLFPEGTKLWKEFTRDGKRVETRLIQKVGPNPEDWAAQAYIWNGEGTDALAAPDGAQNAGGTPHDVPSSTKCMGCHDGTESRALGFSAIQLAYDAPAGSWDLRDLIDEGRLSSPPDATIQIPGNEVERNALGYLHANCAHCHNLSRPPRKPVEPPPAPMSLPHLPGLEHRCYDPSQSFDFFLRLGELGSVEATATYRTAVGSVIDRGSPEKSAAVKRIRNGEMPPLGVEVVDEAGIEMLSTWIRAL